MAYFIFLNNNQNSLGALYKIAENQSDLNNLNIIKSDYKIIEDSQFNFDFIKYGKKIPIKYDNDILHYVDETYAFKNKIELENYLTSYKNAIKNFIFNNKSHPLFKRWYDYLNQLNYLNLDTIQYPLLTSLEEYFNSLGQPSYNILQIP